MENYLPGGHTKQKSHYFVGSDVECLSEVGHDCMQKMAEYDEAHQESLSTDFMKLKLAICHDYKNQFRINV